MYFFKLHDNVFYLRRSSFILYTRVTMQMLGIWILRGRWPRDIQGRGKGSGDGAVIRESGSDPCNNLRLQENSSKRAGFLP